MNSCYSIQMVVAELVFHRDGQDLFHVRLRRGETTIGSHPTNDVVLPDANLSDVVAVLVDRGANRYAVRDLTSGLLRINDAIRDADEIELKHGDRIDIGSFSLRFQLRESAFFAPSDRQTATFGEQANPTHDAMPKARLVIDGGTRHLDGRRPIRIGSHEDNDVVIDDAFVSSFHCRITAHHGRYMLVDLGSTNGTSVNGLRVGQTELPSPARIDIGHASLTFELDGAEDFEPPPSGDGEFMNLGGLVSCARSMRAVFSAVRKMADVPAPVLITGESGTGKELIARALHDESSRKDKPYLALNCGALAGSMIEGELFGHVKGAFTGAQHDKRGAFEAAQGGTLFLDEIGEMPLELQPRLLRVLEQQVVRRVGATHESKIDVRIVAATHRDLVKCVQEGTFREDLFHRLFVLSIDVPPLRDRREDIQMLSRHFLRVHAGSRVLRLLPDAEAVLAAHTWPGNVRELKNVLLRAVLMAEGDTIGADALKFPESAPRNFGPSAHARVRHVDADERQRMLVALTEAGGNRTKAAHILGVSKSTFHDRLKRLGVPLKRSESPQDD